ncbi:MAG: bifunctional ADP-dependent NAD(P)H-hydrate dehydratase/NAD(P)H-hydrate epimerase [Acidimicrobiales bacterium]
MRPVVTVAEMREADAAAPVPEATLVRRAGTAAAVSALRLLGGAYGRRVVVVAGKGNNGADGRVAGELLRRRGARVTVVGPADTVPPCDLVVDAALGTGLRGPYDAPEIPAGAKVLAIDVPSGVHGDTGEAPGRPMRATRTVTFGALKPGLLQGDGPRLAGDVEVADIGLGALHARIWLAEDADVAAHVPARPRDSHKWATAVAVVAGSPGMEGAAVLATDGAMRAGAGMVRLGVPGVTGATGAAIGGGGGGGGGSTSVPAVRWPVEAVRFPLAAARHRSRPDAGDAEDAEDAEPGDGDAGDAEDAEPGDGDAGEEQPGWADDVLRVLERCRALVVGPGLGRDAATQSQVRRLISRATVPVVADADALYALGGAEQARAVLAGDRPVVVTPHDGEYGRLLGDAPGPDRVAAARRLASALGATVLVKGSLTAVATAGGEVALSNAGGPQLATAGSGDVLSGVVGAFLARGMPPLLAASVGAHVHGRAAALGPPDGLVAADLPTLVARFLSAVHGG